MLCFAGLLRSPLLLPVRDKGLPMFPKDEVLLPVVTFGGGGAPLGNIHSKGLSCVGLKFFDSGFETFLLEVEPFRREADETRDFASGDEKEGDGFGSFFSFSSFSVEALAAGGSSLFEEMLKPQRAIICR